PVAVRARRPPARARRVGGPGRTAPRRRSRRRRARLDPDRAGGRPPRRNERRPERRDRPRGVDQDRIRGGRPAPRARPPHPHADLHGDRPVRARLLAGAALGAVVGAVVGASVPAASRAAGTAPAPVRRPWLSVSVAPAQMVLASRERRTITITNLG